MLAESSASEISNMELLLELSISQKAGPALCYSQKTSPQLLFDRMQPKQPEEAREGEDERDCTKNHEIVP